MKNLITLILMIVSFNLFSQVEKPITKGHFLIGGSASGGFQGRYNSGNISPYSDEYIYVGLSPTLGYFVIDGLAIGFSIGTSVTKYISAHNEGTSFYTGTGPMVKYYTPLGIFAGCTVNYSLYNYTSERAKYNQNAIDITPNLGYAYFINSKIALETSINYGYKYEYPYQYTYLTTERDVDSVKYRNVYFSIGFQIFL